MIADEGAGRRAAAGLGRARGPIVVGLGSPGRGDDAIGSTVAAAIARLKLVDVEVVTNEDPTALVHLWDGTRFAVVIDAIMSSRRPGALVVTEVGKGRPPLPESSWGKTGRGGTHAFGLAAAVELSRSLDCLPHRVVLVGVEAKSFEHGSPMTPRVESAVSGAVERVLQALAGASVGSDA